MTTATLTPTEISVLVALKRAYDEDEGKYAGMQRGWRYATELDIDWQTLDAIPPTLVRTDIQPGRPLAAAGNRRYRITDSGLAALAACPVEKSPPMTETYRTLADYSAILERPFALNEHGFVNRNPYIKKHPIRKRLSEVDPNWSISEPEIMVITDEVVVMRGTLTINGVSRSGVGSATILRHQKVERKDHPDEYVPLNPVEQSRQVSRACKAAASDIIARAALEFGVGAYLKDKPSDRKINNMADLEKWLKELNQKPNPFLADSVQTRIRAALTEHDMDKNGAFKYVLAFALANRPIEKISEAHPDLTPDQFIARIPILAAEYRKQKPAPASPSPSTERAENTKYSGGEVSSDPPMISIPANTVQAGDVVAHVGGCKDIEFAIPVDGNKTEVRYKQNGEVKTGTWSSSYNVPVISGPSFNAATAAATPA